MKTKVYTIFDSKTAAYLQPFYLRSNGEAIRAFTEAVNDPKSTFYKYPEDFILFEIGTWDDNDCCISMLKAPVSLSTGLSLKTETLKMKAPTYEPVQTQGI